MFRSAGFPVFVKRILLLALTILLAALQNTDGLLPEFFGARLFPLIPFAVCVGMCEGELSGLFYGLLGGAFWDVCAGGPDGIHALLLAFFGAAAGFLVHFFMKNTLFTQYCLSAAGCAVSMVSYWFFTVSLTVGDSGHEKLLGFYLPSAVVTAAFSFLLYYLTRLISVKLTVREEKTGKMRQTVQKHPDK